MYKQWIMLLFLSLALLLTGCGDKKKDARGGNVNARNDKGATPLFLASLNGHTEIVRILLDKGADPNLKVKDSESPLGVAAIGCHSGRRQA